MIYWFELLLFTQLTETTTELRKRQLRPDLENTFHTSAAYKKIDSCRARGQYPVVFLQKYYMAEISAEA